MFDKEAAKKRAELEVGTNDFFVIDDEGVRELRSGWFFPFKYLERYYLERYAGGSPGIIISKHRGDVLHLGSGCDLEQELEFYDRGYQYNEYDLVITSVEKRDEALAALQELELSVVEPEYKHGTVWRIPRPLTRRELEERLSTLPCVFAEVILRGHRIEVLERTRSAGAMQFEVLKCSRPR